MTIDTYTRQDVAQRRDFRQGDSLSVLDIFDAIIFFSTIDGDERLPTDTDYILKPFRNSVFHYITEKLPEILDTGDLHVWDNLKKIVDGSGEKLEPKIKDSVLSLLKPKWFGDYGHECGYSYAFEDHYLTGVMGAMRRPTTMSSEAETNALMRVIPNLSRHQLRNAVDIGRLLRKYIVRQDQW